MASDTYSAVWVSHSSISDYLKCPRAYYLNNVYKDPQTNHKISIINPSLALGQAVHEVIESLSTIPTSERFSIPLYSRLDTAWKKISGIKGGFQDKEQEHKYYQRARTMIKNVTDHKGPLSGLAVKIKGDLPHFWLSEEDNIILCGKIDWLEYLPESDSVNIIDFKTGKKDEDANSLQLPIYLLLASNCQPRPVSAVSYWYIEREPQVTKMTLPHKGDAYEKVLALAKKIKLARQLNKFTCPHGGCWACQPLETVVAKKAQLVGVNEYRQDVYVLPPSSSSAESSYVL